MEAGIVPCGFTVVYLLRNRNKKNSEDITETAVRSLIFGCVVAALGVLSPSLAWACVLPPLILFCFFLVYQKTRS